MPVFKFRYNSRREMSWVGREIVRGTAGGQCSGGTPELPAFVKVCFPVYSDTTQLNSTSSCRHVHSVNNCHRSVLNVVTQLTQFVGHDVIYDVFWRVCREMEFWSEEFEEKLIELLKKHACLYDVLTKAFSDHVKKQLHCRSSATVDLRRWGCL